MTRLSFLDLLRSVTQVPLSSVPSKTAPTTTLNFPVNNRSLNLSVLTSPEISLSVPPTAITPRTFDLLSTASPRALAILQKANVALLASSVFPPGADEERFIAEVFTGWLCVMDDVVEDMADVADVERLITKLLSIVYSALDEGTAEGHAAYDTEPDNIKTALNTTHICCNVITGSSIRTKYQQSILEILVSILSVFIKERSVKPNDPLAWLQLHSITMGVMPFLILLRAFTDSDSDVKEIERLVVVIAGLQNDLYGLERDARNNDPLNSVLMLAKRDGKPVADVIEEVGNAHNVLVAEVERRVASDDRLAVLVSNWVGGHARWAGRCRRYVQ